MNELAHSHAGQPVQAYPERPPSLSLIIAGAGPQQRTIADSARSNFQTLRDKSRKSHPHPRFGYRHNRKHLPIIKSERGRIS
jgi:hypothetical protein